MHQNILYNILIFVMDNIIKSNLDIELSNNYDDGYDSSNEIDIEVIDYENDHTIVYSVPYKPTFNSKKRLICFSKINDEKCMYGAKCTYAHSLDEQIIDEDKYYTYQIIFDKNQMKFYSLINPKTEDIYKNLLFMTHICDQCQIKKCTGGHNCRNGVFDISLKICKNDLLSGECLNKLIDIVIDKQLLNKLKTNNFEPCDSYKGCINGHHITQRNLIPYYKYIQQKENTKKNEYQSIRYIDVKPINKFFKNHDNSYSSESTDEELNCIFSKYNDNSSDDNNNYSDDNNNNSDDNNNNNYFSI